MKTSTPENRSGDPQRQHLETQLQELTRQYEQLTARIAALDTDFGREIDSERRLLLKQRRQEQSDERDQIGAKIAEVEHELAGTTTAPSSRPAVPEPSSAAANDAAAPASRSVLHRYIGFLAAGAGLLAVVILALLLNPLVRPDADVPTTTSVPEPIIQETEPVVASSEVTWTATPVGPAPEVSIAVAAISEPTVAKSDALTATSSLTLTTMGDVIITQLDASKATRRYEFARRLEQDLRRRLEEYDLENVSVAVSPQVIGDAQEARKLAEQAGGKAVIWGWYDDLDVGIRIEFLEEESTKTSSLASTTGLPLLQAGEQQGELAVVVREVLPQNVSFLSLFVIGHLGYLANDYELGHRAFDGAMETMPPEANLENDALLHFFQARRTEDSDTPEDVVTTVCGYSDAIQADPSFAASYNNLASVISRRFIPQPGEEQLAMPDSVITCLQAIGAYGEPAAEIPLRLYDIALEKQPGLAVAEYNRASYNWNQSQNSGCIYGDDCVIDTESLTETLQNVLVKDNSFVGAYVILGNLAFENRDFDAARGYFEQAAARAPEDTRIQFNLAQTLRKLGNSEIESLLEQAIGIDGTVYEAALALATLTGLRGDTQKSSSWLELIPAASGEMEYLTSPEAMAHFLRAARYHNDGELAAAIEQLEILSTLAQDDSLLRYLLALMYESIGNDEAAQSNWEQIDMFPDSGNSILRNESFFRVQNASSALAWYQIIQNCGQDVFENDCLPTETNARIRALFKKMIDVFDERLYYNRGTLIGLDYFATGQACPYVYTIDSKTGEWQLDTTILYELVGSSQERFQPRPLRNFDGRLLVREEEAEISYIDRIYVLIETSSGPVVQLEAVGQHADALSMADDRYLILKPGDEVELQFPDFDSQDHRGRVRVVAKGYYDPIR